MKREVEKVKKEVEEVIKEMVSQKTFKHGNERNKDHAEQPVHVQGPAYNGMSILLRDDQTSDEIEAVRARSHHL